MTRDDSLTEEGQQSVQAHEHKQEVQGSCYSNLVKTVDKAQEAGISDAVIQGFFMALAGGKKDIKDLTNKQALQVQQALEQQIKESEGK